MLYLYIISYFIDMNNNTYLESIINRVHTASKSVIQEWISECIQTDIDKLFSDYSDEFDSIKFMFNNKCYHIYLVTMPYTTGNLVDEDVLNQSEDAKLTMQIVYDSVSTIFAELSNNISKKQLIPVFIKNKMAFKMLKYNKYEVELDMLKKQKNIILECEYTEENLSKLEKINALINSYKDDDIIMEERKNANINLQLEKSNYLHVVLEPLDEDIDEEEVYSKLPVVGLKYIEPDEDITIDKI